MATMGGQGEDVYCTLLMSDSYLPGAAVLARSLRDAGTKKKLAVLVTLDTLLPSTITELKELFDHVIPVERLVNPSIENLVRLDRMDLRFAFTKIALWRQEQFRKIVYVDADIVALRAPDELFDIDSHFAAAPDIGWPDCFNSGVMALTPNISEYWSLHTLAASGTSFDGADQGLLNEYFGQRPWHRLSFTYNCTPSSSYQYEPAYRHFRSSINMVHFIGRDKPWKQGRQALSSQAPGVYKELLGKWWSTYDRHYKTPGPSALGQVAPHNRVIQQYVAGEQALGAFGWDSVGQRPAPPQPSSHPEPPPNTPFNPSQTPATSVEQPLIDPQDLSEAIRQGKPDPTPAPTQRSFSPPKNEWDATRTAPPQESRPEARNFPSTRYEMSRDRELFHAPSAYPQPPRGMYYQVPEIKPSVVGTPKPIFPWEKSGSQKKPTRVFAEDTPVPPPQQPEKPASPLPVKTEPTPGPRVVAIQPPDPWTTFSRTNAWDDNESIDRYVRALKESQQRQRRGPVQVIHQHQLDTGSASMDFALSSPTSPPLAQRRESLILTDFPTDFERPSLPVTPAPITRRSFWGGERDDDGNLPSAEGVPEQVDWVSKCPRCGYALAVPVPPGRASGGFMGPGLSAASFKKAATTPRVNTSPSVISPASHLKKSPSRGNGLTRGFTFHKNPLERLEELRRSSIHAPEDLEKARPAEVPFRPMPGSSVQGGSVSPDSRTPLAPSASGSVPRRPDEAILSPSETSSGVPVLPGPTPKDIAGDVGSYPVSTSPSGSERKDSGQSSSFASGPPPTVQSGSQIEKPSLASGSTGTGYSSQIVREIMEKRTVDVGPRMFTDTSTNTTQEGSQKPKPAVEKGLPQLSTGGDKGGLFDEYSIA